MTDEVENKLALMKKTDEVITGKVGDEVSRDPSVLDEARKLKSEIEEQTKRYQEERLKFERLAAEFQLGGSSIAGVRQKTQEEKDQEAANKLVEVLYPKGRR